VTQKANEFSASWLALHRRRHALKKSLIAVLPEHLLRQIQFEWHMLLIRLRSWNIKSRYAGQRGLLINIGAGPTGRPGWVNLDGFSAKGVNCLYDVRKRLPFPDASVKGIYSEHFLEHLDYLEEVPAFLAECHRVLQHDGVIRIIVPDAGKYLAAYVRGGWQELATLRPLGPGNKDYYFNFTYNTPMELINVVFRQAQEHKFAYDYETLDFLLKRHGFTEVRQQAFRRSLESVLCLDTPARASESLYVEAVKRSPAATMTASTPQSLA
jgi:predicted SAM-dependent methyltransferase